MTEKFNFNKRIIKLIVAQTIFIFWLLSVISNHIHIHDLRPHKCSEWDYFCWEGAIVVPIQWFLLFRKSKRI